jgi:hypothetical protein
VEKQAHLSKETQCNTDDKFFYESKCELQVPHCAIEDALIKWKKSYEATPLKLHCMVSLCKCFLYLQ